LRVGVELNIKYNVMELLSIKTMSNTLTEILETKCGKKYVLVQTYNSGGLEMTYSVYDLNGVEVTDDPAVDEMMGRYFDIKSELESGLYSDEVGDNIDE